MVQSWNLLTQPLLIRKLNESLVLILNSMLLLHPFWCVQHGLSSTDVSVQSWKLITKHWSIGKLNERKFNACCHWSMYWYKVKSGNQHVNIFLTCHYFFTYLPEFNTCRFHANVCQCLSTKIFPIVDVLTNIYNSKIQC